MSDSSVKKQIEVEISATGAADVRRAFSAVSATLSQLRSNGGRSLDLVNKGFKNILGNVGGLMRGMSPLLGVMKNLSISAAKFGFATALGSVGALFGAISKVRDVIKEAIDEERRLTNNAAIFNIQPKLGTDLREEVMGALEYAFAKTGSAQKDEVKDIITPLIQTLQEAKMGDTSALDKLGKIGLSLDDVLDTKGNLKDIDTILGAMSQKYKGMDSNEALAGLVGIFGDSDSQKVATFLNQGPTRIRNIMKEYIDYVDLKKSDLEISREIVQAQAKELLGYQNLQTSLKRGFGAAFAKVTQRRTKFIEDNRSDFEGMAKALGDSYERIYSSLYDELTKLTQSLQGPAGEFVGGPLETGLRTIETIIKSVVVFARSFIELIATGSTDHKLVNQIADAFKTVRDFVVNSYNSIVDLVNYIKNDFYQQVKPFIEFIDSLLEKMGADKGWEKAGIIAALVLFRGSILGILQVGGGIVKLITSIGGAAVTAATGISSLAAGLATVAAIGGTAAGYGITKSAKSLDDKLKTVKQINDEMTAQGKTQEEIAGYLEVYLANQKQMNGTPIFERLMNGVENIPFLGGEFTSPKDLENRINEIIEQGMKKQGGSDSVNAGRRQAELDIQEEQGIPAVLEVNGVNMSTSAAAAIEQVKRDLTVPITLDIQKGLSKMAGEDIGWRTTSDTKTPYFGDADDRNQSIKEVVRVDNLTINNENFGTIYLAPDAYEKIKRNDNMARRAR